MWGSRAKPGEVLKTPYLEFAYGTRDFTAMREMGASWKIVTKDTPQFDGIDRSGRAKGKNVVVLMENCADAI